MTRPSAQARGMAAEPGLVPMCRVLEPAPRPMPPGLGAPRLKAIRITTTKWALGTDLTYHFLAGDQWDWPEIQKDAVRRAFKTWKDIGIGLTFREVETPLTAKLRIGFLQGDGSWSWVGTELNSNAKPDGRNMNYGWDLTDDWGRATALHEIGHAIGLQHEHQSPKSGIVWNEEAVYAYYKAKPNEWDRDQTYENIIRKLAASQVEGSNWDPTSIMHYPFEPGLISLPQLYRDRGTPRNIVQSPNDIAWVRSFYPAPAKAIAITSGESADLATTIGAQSDFAFVADATRDYVLQTIGTADTLIVLDEVLDEGHRQLAASDDSGTPHNARIEAELEKGKRYIARVRTNYAEPGTKLAFELA